MKKIIIVLLLIYYSNLVVAQKSGNYHFSIADSMRGNINSPLRSWDAIFYDLNILVDIEQKKIRGYNKIIATSTNYLDSVQVDLFKGYTIDSIVCRSGKVKFRKNYDFLVVYTRLKPLLIDTIAIYYSGFPQEAKRAPWDGGFVWSQDNRGKPWVGVACEGLGASSWWPLKDHLSDEPDSMRITVAVPDSLMAVCNGNLRSITKDSLLPKYSSYEWFISYPINSYNVTLNIADYITLQDTFNGKGGVLKLDYYILPYNKSKAQEHFKQVKTMLKCFEAKLGPYPFYKDGYALVETPYWGMEHQGAIAYGNDYINNDFDFDFIIVHESGHEWFGNNLSCKDHAEMWIHESFTTYTETMMVECLKDKAEADRYIIKQKSKIKNTEPMLGPLQVNYDGWKSSDIYYKGAWMLHTLRHVVDNEGLWHTTIRDMYDTFRLKTVSSEEIINYFNQKLGKDYTYFFNQYLKYTTLPKLYYNIVKDKDTHGGRWLLEYKWIADEENFSMPIDVIWGKGKKRLYPTTNNQYLPITPDQYRLLKPDTDHFLISE